MIKRIVERWEATKSQVRETFTAAHPEDYEAIVRTVVSALADRSGVWGERDWPDPERITCINHSEYEGTLLFVVGAGGSRPSTYWAVAIDYGSCSGCDTLEAIHDARSNGKPTPKQVDGYMTLALHVVQRLRQIAGYRVDEELPDPDCETAP